MGINCRGGRGPRPDIDGFKPVVAKALCHVQLAQITLDAGYDAESNHRFAREEHDIRTIIPAKHGRPSAKPPAGRYGRLLKTRFERTAYRRRSQVGTVMSMIKRPKAPTSEAARITVAAAPSDCSASGVSDVSFYSLSAPTGAAARPIANTSVLPRSSSDGQPAMTSARSAETAPTCAAQFSRFPEYPVFSRLKTECFDSCGDLLLWAAKLPHGTFARVKPTD